MSLTWESIQGNAIAFVTRWKDASNEEAQAQSFTTDFLKVFGIDDPEKTGDFEYKVSLDEILHWLKLSHTESISLRIGEDLPLLLLIDVVGAKA